MKRTLLAALVLALPHIAHARQQTVTCDFTRECIDDTECYDTDFQLEFTYATNPDELVLDSTAPPPDPFSVQVTTISETFRAAPLLEVPFDDKGAFGFVSFTEDRTHRLMTIRDGVGRYSLHMLDEGLALFYLGTCSEAAS